MSWLIFSYICLGSMLTWLGLGIAGAIMKKSTEALQVSLLMCVPGFIVYLVVHLNQ